MGNVVALFIEKSRRVEDRVRTMLRNQSADLIDPIAIGSAYSFEAHLAGQGESLRIGGEAGYHNRGQTQRAGGKSGTQADWTGALDDGAVTGGKR